MSTFLEIEKPVVNYMDDIEYSGHEKVKKIFEECMAMVERRGKIYEKANELIRITGNMDATMDDEMAVLEQVFDDLNIKYKSKLSAIDTIYHIGMMDGKRVERARRRGEE